MLDNYGNGLDKNAFVVGERDAHGYYTVTRIADGCRGTFLYGGAYGGHPSWQGDLSFQLTWAQAAHIVNHTLDARLETRD